MRFKFGAVVVGFAFVLGPFAAGVRADMMLTADGLAAGFGLSTFAYNFPNFGPGNVGPVGIGFPSTGGVLVSDYFNGNFYRLSDVDGHDISLTVPSSSGQYADHNITGLANSGGTMYVALQGSWGVQQLDDNGSNTGRPFFGGGAIAAATGLVTNPNNGHLFVSSPGWGSNHDVDPVSGTVTSFYGSDMDGLTTDGTTLYGADVSTHTIQGYRISDGKFVYESPFISGMDGSALGTGKLVGNIFVNTNFGELYEVNLTTNAETLIASGGSRGDLVSVDPSNGTLLLTQTDSVLRLTAPLGGGFGPGVPEPGTLTLLGIGGLSLLGYAFRRRKQAV